MAEEGGAIVLGEEAHTVSEAENGPRYRPLASSS